MNSLISLVIVSLALSSSNVVSAEPQHRRLQKRQCSPPGGYTPPSVTTPPSGYVPPGAGVPSPSPSVLNANYACTTTGFTNTYIIQSGDTCFAIANEFNTQVSALVNANTQNAINCTNLPIGAEFCVPDPRVCPATQITHSIVSGDTCSSLISGTSWQLSDLLNANPSINCTNLPIGNIVCIDPPCQSCPNTYTVKTGDTCYAIANSLNIKVSALQYMNPSINCASLSLNQQLCLVNVPKCSSPLVAHTVVTGDTCNGYFSSMPTKWNVGNFYAANPGFNCTTLQPGNVVCLLANLLSQ